MVVLIQTVIHDKRQQLALAQYSAVGPGPISRTGSPSRNSPILIDADIILIPLHSLQNVWIPHAASPRPGCHYPRFSRMHLAEFGKILLIDQLTMSPGLNQDIHSQTARMGTSGVQERERLRWRKDETDMNQKKRKALK